MKMVKLIMVGWFLVLVIAGMSCRNPPQVPEEEFQFISTEDLGKGIKERSLMIFDNNSPELYEKKHIPTAVHMDFDHPDPKILPPEKNSPLVFYCKNTRCTASHEGARYAKSQGYTQVRVYPLGIDGWEKAGMPLESGSLSMD